MFGNFLFFPSCPKNEDPLTNRAILYQMVALYDYNVQGPEDLEFSEGDTIDILSEGTYTIHIHIYKSIFLLLILLMLHTSDGVRQVFFLFCSEWWVVRRTRCWKYRHIPSKFCSSGYRQHQWGINRLTQPLIINSGCITLQWIRSFSCAATVLRGPSVKN